MEEISISPGLNSLFKIRLAGVVVILLTIIIIITLISIKGIAWLQIMITAIVGCGLVLFLNTIYVKKVVKVATIDEFNKYVYKFICQCKNQCINDNVDKKEQTTCSQIMVPKESIYKFNINKYDLINYYSMLIRNAIQHFSNEEKILQKYSNKYYINDVARGTLKLTWENMKLLKEFNTKESLWLFRKLIVDTLLKKLIVKHNLYDKVQIYSVGSTNITSDYDVTLYGDNKEKMYIIKEFQKEFINIFHEHSSIVFDTNIYGKAYISFEPEYPDLSTQASCGNMSFYTLNESPSPASTILWGLVKFFGDIEPSLGEKRFNEYIKFMYRYAKMSLVEKSYMTLTYLRNRNTDIINYVELFKDEQEFVGSYKKKLLGIHDYISLINFYGVETYYTRGAFIDTVVNRQMCKKTTVQLHPADLVASILENCGFFFAHPYKTKYFVRFMDTFKSLVEIIPKMSDIERKDYFQSMIKLQTKFQTKVEDKIVYDDSKYCKWINNDSFSLMDCDQYTIMDSVMHFVCDLLKEIGEDLSNDEVPFFDNFVAKSNSTFGL